MILFSTILFLILDNFYLVSIIHTYIKVYNELMCEIFIEEFKKKRLNYSFYLNKIFNIKMAQCADGFLINTKYLDEIESFYERFVIKNKNMFYDDDLWFSIYLQLVKKTQISKIKYLVKMEK